MRKYKTKMPDPNGWIQQNVFVSKQWKKQGWLYNYKFIFYSNILSDTGQIEILPTCRCRASVIVATISGHIELTHCSYEILRRFKRLQCLCLSPLIYDGKKIAREFYSMITLHNAIFAVPDNTKRTLGWWAVEPPCNCGLNRWLLPKLQPG